ncbi:MAG: protein kinase [Sandaracinaceae bacterium]|nr:protein kinase [Sandaracinaceae bacterium]
MVGMLRLGRGDRFAGELEILRVIGSGGMGTVYAARELATGEVRALKLLLPDLLVDAVSRRRFTQEAEIASAIESPYVPQVHRGGVDPATSTPYIVMELLEGEDLRARVEREGALALDVTRAVLEQLTHALGAAHRAGIVHRDLKPPNVFLQATPGGEVLVKLLDFGVAKLLDAHRTSATGTGAVGSPMWMAPEQTSTGGRIAPSTDVWALGLLVFYLLTGKVFWTAAHDHQGVTGLLREIHLDPIPLPSVRARQLGGTPPLPEGFDAWFERAVCREQRLRFRDASIAMEALRPALQSPSERAAIADAPLALEAPLESSATLPRSGLRTPARISEIPDTLSPDDRRGPTPVDAHVTPWDATASHAPPHAVSHAPPHAASHAPSHVASHAASHAPHAAASSVPVTAPVPARVVPVTAERPIPARSPRSDPPRFTPPAPSSTPPPASGEGRLSPLVWALLVVFGGLAAAFVSALAVWVVLTLATP